MSRLKDGPVHSTTNSRGPLDWRKIGQTNPKQWDWGLIPDKMENCSSHQQCQMCQLGPESRAGVFHSKTWELVWKARGLALGRTLSAQLGSGESHLPAQANPPCTGKPIRLGVQCKENGAQNWQEPPHGSQRWWERQCIKKGHHSSVFSCPQMPPEVYFSSCYYHLICYITKIQPSKM